MVIAQWKAASTRWRKHVTVVPAGRDQQPKIVLDVGEWMEPPADGVARATCQVVTDPFEQLSGASQLRMANDPAFAAFEIVSLDLAEATTAIAVTLEENAIDSTVALQVARDLRRIPRRPTAAVYAAIEHIDLQIDQIGVRTRSQGTEKGYAAQYVAPSNQREAFHRVTMAVYRDLGALVDVLKREPDLRVALLAIEEYAKPGAATEDGDPEFVADIQRAARRLRLSLATAQAIRDSDRRSSRIGGQGESFGGIGSVSHHDALLSAAAEILRPDVEETSTLECTSQPRHEVRVWRRQPIEAAMDPNLWARLEEELEHEYLTGTLLPRSTEPQPTTNPGEGSDNSASAESARLLLSIQEFREAARTWNALIPKRCTVSAPSTPTYYVRFPRPGLPPTEEEWMALGWSFKDMMSDDGHPLRARSARPIPNRSSMLAGAALKLAAACRAFDHADGDVLETIPLDTVLGELAEMLETDPDPSTLEQAGRVREVDLLIRRNAAWKRRIAVEGISEIELARLERKRQRMEGRMDDLVETYALWQETTDLLTRTNLHESARVEELFCLRVIVSSLASAARDRGMPCATLHALGGRLRMLMPREWFHETHTRTAVIDNICQASAEVDDICRTRKKGGGIASPIDVLADATPGPATAEPKADAFAPLRFPRTPDAKQRCLEALMNAPEGIPRHQDIADVIGLELQTVKEAMAGLKKPGFVEKSDRVWRITPKGREHLKLLRGE